MKQIIKPNSAILMYCFLGVLFLACNENQKETTSTKDISIRTFTPTNADEQLIYSRAFNSVIWGMSAVNSELMHESLVKAKGNYNQVVFWSGLINSMNQTLTPNPDVIYVNPFYDTRNGPVVLEIPPVEGVSSITGSIDDGWQTAIEDVGPAGVDKGKGGKYFILPPGYKGKIPANYFPMPSSTYTGFIILRSNLTSGSKEDIARAIEYGKKVKIYPYTNTTTPPPMVFIDLLETPFSNVIPYDIHFFESLNSFIQREPWLVRDMAMIDQLKTIGIVKGEKFSPSDRVKEILTAAIADAHKWLDEEYERVFDQPFYEGTTWTVPVKPALMKAIGENYGDPGMYPIDERAIMYSIGYFSAKHLGGGQFYLMSIKDKSKNSLDGAKQYRLHLPANVPVKLYWSVTVYDRETHAVVKGMPYFSRASTSPSIKKNDDGSVDVFFGPKAPEGKEANWVPTDPQHRFELLARFYGPDKAFFDKQWKMGDVEEVK